MKKIYYIIVIGILMIMFIYMSLAVRYILGFIEDITIILIKKVEGILP